MLNRVLIKQNARQNLKANLFSYIGLMLMPFIAIIPQLFLLQMATRFIYINNTFYFEIDPLALLSFYLISYLFNMFLCYWFVVYSIYVHANNGAKVSIFYVLKDHFTISRFINFVLKILVSSVLIFLWSLLFVIPGIIKAFSYAMVPFLAIDEEHLGIMETISKSRTMMRGYKFSYLILILSFILWVIASALTFGLLSFYLVPYSVLSCTGFYFCLKQAQSKESEEYY